MYFAKRIIVVLMILSVQGCGSSYSLLKPQQEKDFKLSDFATFGFYEVEATGDTVSANFQKNVRIIKSAISQSLQQRGLDEARDANLKINIALSVTEKAQTRQTDFRTEGLPRYMGQRRYTWKSEEVVIGKYREGTMLIDFVDSSSNKMVWQGGASGIVPEKSARFEENIQKVVQDIISKVP